MADRPLIPVTPEQRRAQVVARGIVAKQSKRQASPVGSIGWLEAQALQAQSLITQQERLYQLALAEIEPYKVEGTEDSYNLAKAIENNVNPEYLNLLFGEDIVSQAKASLPEPTPAVETEPTQTVVVPPSTSSYDSLMVQYNEQLVAQNYKDAYADLIKAREAYSQQLRQQYEAEGKEWKDWNRLLPQQLEVWNKEHGVYGKVEGVWVSKAQWGDLSLSGKQAILDKIPMEPGYYEIAGSGNWFQRLPDGGLEMVRVGAKFYPQVSLGSGSGLALVEEARARREAERASGGTVHTSEYHYKQIAIEKTAAKAGAKKTSVNQLTPIEKEIYLDLLKKGRNIAEALAESSAKPEGVSDELWGEIYHRRNVGVFLETGQQAVEAWRKHEYEPGMEKQLTASDLSYYNQLKALPNELLASLGGNVVLQEQQGQYWEAHQDADKKYQERIALIGGKEVADSPDWADKVATLSPEDKAKWKVLLEQERTIRAEARALNSWLIGAEASLDAGGGLPPGWEYYRALAELRPYITVKEFMPRNYYTPSALLQTE
jgi:hypothetical protein